MKKIIIFFILCSCCAHEAMAQVKNTPPLRKSKLYGVARANKNEILIRWAPDGEGAWAQGNKYGYALERYTVVKDGKVLDKFERSQSRMVFKPKPVAEWDSIANKDDYAAVLAQAIYGEEFDVTVSDKSGVAKMINETEKMQQRYNMSMYAVDHSFEAAVFAGLAWRDKNVKAKDKYFYRIYSLIPKALRSVDTALIYIGLSDFKPLPKPSEVVTEFGDKTSILKWDFESYKEYYTSYMVERSDDGGKTFKLLSDKPVTTLNDKQENSAGGSILYLDSLPDNETQYQYRVAGVSLFGDNGPYSDIVKGKGKTALYVTPHIVNVTQSDKGDYQLNWVFEDSLNAEVKEFRINQAESVEGPYKIMVQNLKPDTRSALVDSLAASNYYTVTAVSKEDEERTSLPYLLQPEDSIAPAMPLGLQAVIDSNGVVLLRWTGNTEKDLAGYRIMKTNVKGHEWTPVIDSVWIGTEFRDTLNLKNLNSKAYYTVKAVDQRNNASAFAPAVEVTKTDIIPPAQAVLAGYDLTDKDVKIKWINSADEDVIVHNVYRKIMADTAAQWNLLQAVTDKKIQELTDNDLTEGKTYSYTVVAVDLSKLESAPAIPLTITIPESRVKEAIKKLLIEVDRQNRLISINWQKATDNKNIKQIELYRGEDKQSMSLYQQLAKDAESFTDKDLRVNTRYKYAVRAVYNDGKYSDFVTKNIIY